MQIYEVFTGVLLLIIGIFIFQLVYVIAKNRFYEKQMAKSGIKDVDKMDGYQFEVYLKALFKELGYKPKVTKKTGDFGADLVLEGKNKIVIQAKRYGFKNRVSISAVQEIYAAKTYYKADEAWVITNSLFTKSANLLAEACNVKLLDRHNLMAFINRINPEITPKKIYQKVDPEQRKCSGCGSLLVVRKSSSGNKFMGCSNYPNCKHTEAINKAN